MNECWALRKRIFYEIKGCKSMPEFGDNRRTQIWRPKVRKLRAKHFTQYLKSPVNRTSMKRIYRRPTQENISRKPRALRIHKTPISHWFILIKTYQLRRARTILRDKSVNSILYDSIGLYIPIWHGLLQLDSLIEHKQRLNISPV